MRWLLLSTCLAACGFTGPPGGQSGPVDAPPTKPIDAAIDARPDAPPDAAPLPACKIGVTDPNGTDRGRAGGDGGGDRPALVCASAADRIIGFRMRLSNGNTVFGGPSAYGISIACAAVAIDSTGAATVGTMSTVEFLGIGQQGWTPATPSTLALCQPGWVMYGLNVHTGGGNRFLDVTLRCARLGFDGQRTGQTESIVVMGSGDENNGSDTADCNANEIVARLPMRAGQGVDSVNMACSIPKCQ